MENFDMKPRATRSGNRFGGHLLDILVQTTREKLGRQKKIWVT